MTKPERPEKPEKPELDLMALLEDSIRNAYPELTPDEVRSQALQELVIAIARDEWEEDTNWQCAG